MRKVRESAERREGSVVIWKSETPVLHALKFRRSIYFVIFLWWQREMIYFMKRDILYSMRSLLWKRHFSLTSLPLFNFMSISSSVIEVTGSERGFSDTKRGDNSADKRAGYRYWEVRESAKLREGSVVIFEWYVIHIVQLKDNGNLGWCKMTVLFTHKCSFKTWFNKTFYRL